MPSTDGTGNFHESRTDGIDPPILWISGRGFGTRTKKIILPKGHLSNISPSAFASEGSSGEDAEQNLGKYQEGLKQNIVGFFAENYREVGFLSWVGYMIEGLGRGVVFCDAAEGLEAESIQIEYIPANAILGVLEDQGLDKGAIRALVDGINAYNPETQFLSILFVFGRIFPVLLGEEGRTPVDCYKEMLLAAKAHPPEEDPNA